MEENQSEDTLLARWLAGELSEAELKELQERPEFADWERIAGLSKELAPPPFDAEASWSSFEQKIAEDAPPATQPKLEPVSDPQPEPSVSPARKLLIPGLTLLVAAGIALFFVFGLNVGQKDFATKPGETLALTLPDESEVSLNPSSRLSYNEKTWKDNRELTLEGSAYFKVKRGSKFAVNSDQGKVEVLGTEFQINDRAAGYQVWCLTGKVAVSFAGKTDRVELTREEGVKWDGKGDPAPFDFQSGDFSGLNRNVFRYPLTPLNEVLEEMERQFDIVIQTEGLEGRDYSGAFFRDDLEQSLKLVTDPLGLTYEKTGPRTYFIQPASP